jgi:membrane protease YdiL (CAAX protease family)
VDDDRLQPTSGRGGDRHGSPPARPSAFPSSPPVRNVPPASGAALPWQPGQVPWGWRRAVLGVLVAAGPFALLALTAYLAPARAPAPHPPTLGGAGQTVIFTLVLDGWLVFVAWFFSLRGAGVGPEMWGYRKPGKAIFWTVPLGLAVVQAVGLLYAYVVPNTKEQSVVSDFPRTGGGVLLFVLLACVIAPLFEETFFRGFLFQGFASSVGPLWGAVLSGALFSLSHQQLDIFVPLFALGLVLAWVFYRTRSLWATIACHSAFNAIAVAAWWWGRPH